MNALLFAVTDGITIARRNVLRIRRVPDLLGFVVLTPITLVLLLAYVFGSSITVPGIPYREFLLPGIFVQSVVYSATITGQGLVMDLRSGIIDRYRSLPMSPTALLLGRTVSDMLTACVSLVVMALTGLAAGWRIHTPPQQAALGFALLLLFAYAMSWVMATLGLAIRVPEAFSTASFLVIMPVSFVAGTFVDPSRLPGPLRAFADWNPASAVSQAARELFGNTTAAAPPPGAWPLQHALAASLLWAVLLLTVFTPLATWCYQRAVSR
jgi:ABC-2 type transport system permease protein